MGWQTGKRSKDGLNTSISTRGLRISKTIKFGAFSWNIGGYIGGTHGGKVTQRGTAKLGPATYRKESTVADLQKTTESKTEHKDHTRHSVQEEDQQRTNESLNTFFNLPQNSERPVPQNFTTVLPQPESHWIWDARVTYLLMAVQVLFFFGFAKLLFVLGISSTILLCIAAIPMHLVFAFEHIGINYHDDRYDKDTWWLLKFTWLPFFLFVALLDIGLFSLMLN